MENIRIGIIGHGFMGHEHEKMLTKMEGIQVVGISDIDPEQLKDVKEGLKRYASNEELMNDPEVQVVLIAANNKYHHDLVIQAARAGKDIICEKPVAMNVAELDDMIRVVEECGVKFTVHHQRRLDPDFRTAFLTDKMHDKWFERHWFVGGNKGSAYVDGFGPEGKIVRTSQLLTNVGGKRTMTAAGPTRSFGPPPEGRIITEPLPEVNTCHEDYFENYKKARRVLALMEAVRESARTGEAIHFE